MQIVVKLLRFHVVSDRNDFGLLERLPVLVFIFINWAHLICIMIKKKKKKSLLTLLVE